jgi:hypothetical protein
MAAPNTAGSTQLERRIKPSITTMHIGDTTGQVPTASMPESRGSPIATHKQTIAHRKRLVWDTASITHVRSARHRSLTLALCDLSVAFAMWWQRPPCRSGEP